jgi:tetratricopeptide (TPR) repeat protein
VGKAMVQLVFKLADAQLEATRALGRKDDKAVLPALRKVVALANSIPPSEGVSPALDADQLGDVLLRIKQPKEAAEVFAKTLVEYPGHARALLGLARARKALGDDSGAKEAYTQLFAIWKDADADTPGLAEVKAGVGLASR